MDTEIYIPVGKNVSAKALSKLCIVGVVGGCLPGSKGCFIVIETH
jgi:hypothetical protein